MNQKIRVFSTVFLLMALFLLAAQAAELKVGDRAPNFSLKDSSDKNVSLKSLIGKKAVILVFWASW